MTALSTEPQDVADVARMADELAAAAASRVGIAPLTERYPSLTLELAYAVQLEGVRRRLAAGERLVGRKVGLTNAVMRAQLGVDSPDLGHLFAADTVDSGGELRADERLAPRAEPEIAFVLATDLVGPGVTVEDVLAATAHVLPSLEVIDSRIADWRIGLLDTVADNASGAGTVLGTTPVDPRGLDLAAVTAQLLVGDEVVAEGTGADVLGHPAAAVAWLANALADLGAEPLRAGDVVLPGSCTRAAPVSPGDVVTGRFSGLGDVTVTFR